MTYANAAKMNGKSKKEEHKRNRCFSNWRKIITYDRKEKEMKMFFTGTTLCVVAGLIVVVVALTDLPKNTVVIAIPVLLAGFGLQIVAFWKNRPSAALNLPVQAAPQRRRDKPMFDTPRVLGLLLALLGSIGAVAVGIYVTHNASYLWALILVAIVVEQVSTTKAEYSWKPAVLGLVMGLLSAGLALVIWFVGDANYLWALILIGILTDSII